MRYLLPTLILAVSFLGCGKPDESAPIVSLESPADSQLEPLAAADVTASESEAQPAPPAIGSVEFWLQRAIEQVQAGGTDSRAELATVPENLADTQAAVIAALAKTKQKHPLAITAAREYRDWYLFGIAGSEDEAFKFHAGYAVRKSDTKVYYFGFW